MVVNDRINHLLAELNIKAASFAESIGVNSTVVHNIIKGRRNKPSFEVLRSILTVYTSVNAEWLLKGEGNIWNHYRADGPDVQANVDALLNSLDSVVPNSIELEELSNVIQLLLRENHQQKEVILRLYEKNDKLMDILRNKLGLDI